MPRNLSSKRSRTAVKRASRGQSKLTVCVALIGNLLVALVKLLAGLLTGSAAMLAESGHSFADSINEVLLGISLSRSGKDADPTHPIGYGREGFLWAFIAAIASFVVGGCVSIGLAIRQLSVGKTNANQTLSWIALAIALLVDSASWIQSMNQATNEAKEHSGSVWKYLRTSSDPVLRAVVVEDSAALIGIAIAALGLLVTKIVGNGIPDAIAALLIGVLLAVTAIGLARQLADYLIGRPVSPKILTKIEKIMVASDAIDEVFGLQAVYTGPEEVIVAARIHPACSTVGELALAMDELDAKIKEVVPIVADIFINVTNKRAADSQ